MSLRQYLALGLIACVGVLPMAAADETKTVPPGSPVTITVQPASAATPDVSITLLNRTGRGVPHRSGCSHTGGGNIDVQQPSPDTLVVTMTGVAVAAGAPHCGAQAGFDFDLVQTFDVSFDKPSVKAAKITLEGRVIGLLRGGKNGTAESGPASATVSSNDAGILSIDMPAHAVSGCDNLSINDHDGPFTCAVVPGKYTLHQTFHIGASACKCVWPHKAPSVEFAPDPALDPLWISHKEPFHGAAKKDFGFQVTVKVSPEETKEEKKSDKADLPSPK